MVTPQVKKFLVYYFSSLFGVLMLLVSSSCHMNDPSMNNSTNSITTTSSSAAPNPSKGQNIAPPTITTVPSAGQVQITFNGNGVNWTTGTAVFTGNGQSLLVFSGSAGGAVSTKGFNVGYGGKGGAGANQIVITGTNGSSYNQYSELSVTGFIDLNGTAYQGTNYYFGNTTLTNSPTASYDVDNSRIVLSMPNQMVSSPALVLYIYYTNASGSIAGSKTKINGSCTIMSADRYSLYITNQPYLPDYPLIEIDNLYFISNNSITYLVLPVSQLPAPVINNFAPEGYITLNLLSKNPEDTSTTALFYSNAAPIWTMAYLTNNNYLGAVDGYGRPTIDTWTKLNSLQKWVNWNLKISVVNASKFVLIDNTSGNTILTVKTPFTAGLTTNITYDLTVNTNGYYIPVGGFPFAKWGDITIQVWPAIGNNYVSQEFSSVIDISNVNNIGFSYLGIDNPSQQITAISGSINAFQLIYPGTWSSPQALNCDRIKIYDNVYIYGRSVSMNAALTVNNNGRLIFIAPANCQYTGPSISEEAIEWPSITMNDSVRGIVCAQMRTTVNLQSSGSYARSANNNLFTDRYTGVWKTLYNYKPVSFPALNLPPYPSQSGSQSTSSTNIPQSNPQPNNTYNTYTGNWSIITPLTSAANGTYGAFSGYQDPNHTIYYVPLALIKGDIFTNYTQTGTQRIYNQGGGFTDYNVYSVTSGNVTYDYSGMQYFPNACIHITAVPIVQGN